MKRYLMAGLMAVIFGVGHFVYAAESDFTMEDNTTSSGFSIKEETTGSTIARFRGDGNVGIATTSPTEKLEVSGNVKATKFIGDGSELTGITGGSGKFVDGTDANNAVYTSGNVGIGTTGPLSGESSRLTGLEVAGDIAVMRVRDNNADGVAAAEYIEFFDNNSRQGVIGFNNEDTNLLRIKNEDGGNIVLEGGNVGIGTTAPITKLDIRDLGASFALTVGDSSTDLGLALGYDTDGQTNAYIYNTYDGDDTSDIHFGFGATPDTNVVMTLGKDGNVGIGTTAPDQKLSVNGEASKVGGGSWATFSDVRLKNINTTYNVGLEEVMKLQPIKYNYKAENPLSIPDEGEHVGFSAQAVQELIPEAVSANGKGYLMLNNDPIMWAMLNAIKEQQAQIEQLKTELVKFRSGKL